MWKYIGCNNKIKFGFLGLIILILTVGLVIKKTTQLNIINSKTITFDDIGLGVLMINAKGKPVFEEGKLIRLSEDKKSTLILTGTENNISEIDLSLNHLDKTLRTVDYGVSVISTLIKGAVPEWTEADDWLASAYKSFGITKEKILNKTTKIGDKTVSVTFNVETNSLYLNISKK